MTAKPPLAEIARSLVTAEQLRRLQEIGRAAPFEFAQLSALDDEIPGPSMSQLYAAVRARARFTATGDERLSISDRDVFRPLQYCAAASLHGLAEPRTSFLTRWTNPLTQQCSDASPIEYEAAPRVIHALTPNHD